MLKTQGCLLTSALPALCFSILVGGCASSDTPSSVRADAASPRLDARSSTSTDVAVDTKAGAAPDLSPAVPDAIMSPTGGDARSGDAGSPNVVTPPPGVSARASVDDMAPGDPCKDRLIPEAQGQLEGFQFNMWIPGGIPTLRCVMNGSSGLYDLARQHHCATMRIPSMPTPTGPMIVKALKNFAVISGHPEIEHLQVLGLGYSFTFGERARQSHEAPDRFMAIYGGGIHTLFPKDPDSAKLFWLSYNGDRDNAYIPSTMISMGSNNPWWASNVAQGRAIGARYAQTLRWGHGHNSGDHRHMLLPFFHQTIARRAPKPGVAITKLEQVVVPEADGWLMSTEDWNTPYPTIASYQDWKGDRTKASWLSDAYMAHVARAYTAKDSPVAITMPACVGENCAPPVQDWKTDVTIAATVKGTAPVSVRLFDGDRLLETLTAPPYQFTIRGLGLGVHAFIVEAAYTNGARAVSKPRSVVLVRPKPACP